MILFLKSMNEFGTRGDGRVVMFDFGSAWSSFVVYGFSSSIVIIDFGFTDLYVFDHDEIEFVGF